MSPIKNELHDYFTTLKKTISDLNYNQIEKAVVALMSAYKDNRKIFIMGNGGSASLASHMACDLGKNTLGKIYDPRERRFRVISLTNNIATITAYANDLSFDEIFVQQMKNLVDSDDIVFVISGSGKSPNIIKALEYAKSCGALTIGLLGFENGGPAGQMVDIPIVVNSNHYGIIEGVHTEIEHFITESLKSLKKDWDKVNGASARQHDNTATQQHVNTTTRQHINTPARQHGNAKLLISNFQLPASSTKELQGPSKLKGNTCFHNFTAKTPPSAGIKQKNYKLADPAIAGGGYRAYKSMVVHFPLMLFGGGLGIVILKLLGLI